MNTKKNRTSENGWQDLANAIIAKAARDYCRARIALLKNPQHVLAPSIIRECREFFDSEYYRALTTLDGDYLVERLDRKVRSTAAKYLRKNH